MKKIYYLLLILPLLALLGGCDKQEEIVFDHELPQFELKENAILLEVIMPHGTTAADELYIAGAFNGGEDAVGKLEWKLEKAPDSDVKWGIYLIPSTFADGKTLADGFYFVSKQKGVERSVKNEEVIHTLNVGVGTRTNVTVPRWKSYFESPEEPGDHDGFAIYVEDNSGWSGLAIYGYFNDAPVTPAWPGAQLTGMKTIGKVTYKYFDMGEALKGKSMNLIFNDNGGGKQFNGPQITLDRDYYFRITDTACEEVVPSTYLGYTIYVADNSGWEGLAIYGYANDAPVTPGWPGAQVTGTKVINGVTYHYFEVGETLSGKSMNLIFNNNGGGAQFNGPEIKLDRDFYFSITDTASKEVDPNAPVIDPDEPEVETYAIYVEDKTGWSGLAVYGWNDNGNVANWPGLQLTGTKEIGGKTFKYFEYGESLKGKTFNLIFNNNVDGSGIQFDGPSATLNGNLYFSITATECTVLDAPVTAKTNKR